MEGGDIEMGEEVGVEEGEGEEVEREEVEGSPPAGCLPLDTSESSSLSSPQSWRHSPLQTAR